MTFEFCRHRRGFWFRVNGRGFSAKYGPELFSERNGFRKTFRFGKVMFEVLR